jgi:hypothetical protein
MPIALEKIPSMKIALDNIDLAVYKLTDIFFEDFNKIEITQELLEQIQSYVVKMSVMIPEIKVYLKFMELGVFDKIEHIVNRFDTMEEYIKVTEMYCEELLKELNM